MGVKKSGKGGVVVPMERISQAILLIRGHKVMLSTDLAELYGGGAARPCPGRKT